MIGLCYHAIDTGAMEGNCELWGNGSKQVEDR